MTINNTEYDLDLLLQKHGPNVIDSARELRAATGVTLKDAMNIIDTYQKDGILPKTGSAEPDNSKGFIIKLLLFCLVLGILINIFISLY